MNLDGFVSINELNSLLEKIESNKEHFVKSGLLLEDGEFEIGLAEFEAQIELLKSIISRL